MGGAGGGNGSDVTTSIGITIADAIACEPPEGEPEPEPDCCDPEVTGSGGGTVALTVDGTACAAVEGVAVTEGATETAVAAVVAGATAVEVGCDG